MKLLGVKIGESRHAARGRSGLGELLERNASLREVFASSPQLRTRLEELQRWQSERLLRSHADLRDSTRYHAAIEFFFKELYGGGDPRARDRDLQRVQRVMEKLLPAEALRALTLAIELEVMSQELDADMVRALAPGPITVATYANAYRAADRRADRERQIALLDVIGGYLDRVVRTPIVRGLVRIARGPAHAAGFGALQEFLERGLDAFEAMHGADEFLAAIRQREQRSLERLFAGDPDPFGFEGGRRESTG